MALPVQSPAREAAREFALVVRHAPAEPTAIALAEFERRAVPERGRILGLHVVMVVDHKCDRPAADLANHEGADLSGVYLRPEPCLVEEGANSPGAFLQPLGPGANRGDRDQSPEVVPTKRHVFIE